MRFTTICYFLTLCSVFFNTLLSDLGAQTIQVSSSSDSGPGTLREAFSSAQSSTTPPVIEINSVVTTINLLDPLPPISNDLTLKTAQGAVVEINCNSNFRAITLLAGTSHISDIRFVESAAQGGSGGDGRYPGGGGAGMGGTCYIHSGSILELSGVEISQSSCRGGNAGIRTGSLGAGAGGGLGGKGGDGRGYGGSGGGGFYGSGAASAVSGDANGGGGGGGFFGDAQTPISNNPGGGSGGGGSDSQGALSNSINGSDGGSQSGGGGGGGASNTQFGLGGLAGSPSANPGGNGIVSLAGNGGDGGVDPMLLYGGGGGGSGGSFPRVSQSGGDGGFGGGGGGQGDTSITNPRPRAGNGGFGGGGGSSGYYGNGGDGGFGGGGGASFLDAGGPGGYGAGGGAGRIGIAPGGLFGGDAGVNGAGGGSALGGCFFVHSGGMLHLIDPISLGTQVLVAGSATPGSNANDGEVAGTHFFVMGGGTLIFTISQGQFSLPSAIEGDGGGSSAPGLVKRGAGILDISQVGMQTFSGVVRIEEGAVRASSDAQLGLLQENIILAGGGIVASSGYSIINKPIDVDVQGGFIEGLQNSTLQVNSLITGTGNLSFITPTSIELRNASQLQGSLSFDTSTLVLNQLSDLPQTPILLSGATVTTSGVSSQVLEQDVMISQTAASTFTVPIGSLQLNGAITGGAVEKNGAGELIVANGLNSFSSMNILSGNTTFTASSVGSSMPAELFLQENTVAKVTLSSQNATINTTIDGIVPQNPGSVAELLLEPQPGSTLQLSGAISGTISLVKSGGGLLIANATSTYSGTTMLDSGITRVNGINPFSNSTVFLDSSILEYQIPSTVVNPIQANGFATIRGVNVDILYAEALTGSGSIQLEGGALHTLTKLNQLQNGITIIDSMLKLEGNAQQGTTSHVLNNSALVLDSLDQITAPLTLVNSSSIKVDTGVASINGQLLGNTIRKLGQGTLQLSGTAKQFTSLFEAYEGTTEVDAMVFSPLAAAVIGDEILFKAGSHELISLSSVSQTLKGAVILQGADVTLTATLGINSALYGSITGTGSITKSGSGAMQFYGDLPYQGIFALNNGTAHFFNSVNADSVDMSVGAQGTLHGGVSLQSLDNRGVISVSKDDTISVNHDLFLRSDSELRVEISSIDLGASTLEADAITIEPQARLVVQAEPIGTYINGSVYPIFTARTSITGAYQVPDIVVVDPGGLLSLQANYYTSGNEAGIVIGTFPASTSSFIILSDAVKVGNEVHTAALEQRFLQNQVEFEPLQSRTWQVYGNYGFSRGVLTRTAEGIDSRYLSNSALGGTMYALSPFTTFGLEIAGAKTQVTTRPLRTNGIATSLFATIFTSIRKGIFHERAKNTAFKEHQTPLKSTIFSFKGFSFDSAVSVSYSKLKEDRVFAFGPSASGSTQGASVACYTSLAYHMPMLSNPDQTIAPMCSLSLLYTHIDEYVETGSDGTKLLVSDDAFSDVWLSAGIFMHQKRRFNDIVVVPNLFIGYKHGFAVANRAGTISLVEDSTNSNTFFVQDFAESSIYINGGITATVKDTLSMYVEIGSGLSDRRKGVLDLQSGISLAF